MTTALSFLVLQNPPVTEVPVTYLGLKPSEWIMIAAILVGPILAVVTQFIWQRYRQKADAKMWVFSTMMSLRGFPLNLDFIRAVNSIDVVFYKNQKIRDRWKDVLAHLSSDAYKPENFTQQAFEKFRDLLSVLLAEMAKDLGYEYDHTLFKERAWTPTWHITADEEGVKLRKALLASFDEAGGLNVVVRPHPGLLQQASPAQASPPQAPGAAPQPPPVQPAHQP
jgi:hypothetical protein